MMCVECTEKKRIHNFVLKLRTKIPSGIPRCIWKIILKWSLNKYEYTVTKNLRIILTN